MRFLHPIIPHCMINYFPFLQSKNSLNYAVSKLINREREATIRNILQKYLTDPCFSIIFAGLSLCGIDVAEGTAKIFSSREPGKWHEQVTFLG